MSKKKVTDFIGQSVEYDQYGGAYIWGKKGNPNNPDLSMVMDIHIRGWGEIQNMFKDIKEAEDFQDEVGEWIADAINQKLQKERQ